MRERAAMFDLTAFCVFDVVGPGALDACRRSRRGRWTCRTAASSTRRCSRRAAASSPTSRSCGMDDDRFRVVTGGAHGMADMKWFRDHLPPTARADRRPHLDRLHASACGGRGRATSSPRSRATTSRTRRSRSARGRTLEVDGARRARLAHLVRRRPRLGAVRADRAGRAAVGRALGGGPAARRRPGRHRRLRHDRPAREGYRAFGAELDAGLRRRRGRHGVVEGEGRGLRRQGGARRAARGASRRRCSARSRSTTTRRERRQALPARPRADRARATARRSSTRRAAARTSRAPARGRRSASTSSCRTCRPSTRSTASSSAVEYMDERYPGHGRGRRLDAAVRSRQRADPLVRILVCVKRVPHDRRADGAHRRRAGDRDEAPRLHDQPHEECAVEEAVRLVEANGGESSCSRSARRRRRSSCATAWRSAPTAASCSKTDEEWDAQATAAAIVEAIARRGAVRPDPVRQRVGGRRRLPGRHPRRARARAAGRHRAEEDRGRATGGCAASGRPAAARDVYEVPLPAVLTVLEGLNLPRYPSVPGRLRAKSKPLAIVEPARPGVEAREAAARRARGAGQAGRDPRRRRRRRAARRRGAAGAGGRVMHVLVFVERRPTTTLAAGARASRALARRRRARSPFARRVRSRAALGAGRRRRRARERGRDRRRRLATAATSCSRTSRRCSTSRSPRTDRAIDGRRR